MATMRLLELHSSFDPGSARTIELTVSPDLRY